MTSWRSGRQRRLRNEQNRDPLWHWNRGPQRGFTFTTPPAPPSRWWRVEAIMTRRAVSARCVPTDGVDE